MSSGPSHRRGFTLLELMASMAVGMLVLLVAVGMLRSTGDGYERLNGGVGAEREARALLGQLTADLGSARFHKDSLLEKGIGKWPVDRIGFLTLQPEDTQLEANRIGDLCAVRYYVKDQTVGGKTIRCLMRGFVESQETFQKLRENKISGLFQEPVPSGSANSSNADEAIAFGVVSFEARPQIRDSSGNVKDWQSSSSDPPNVVKIRLVVARRELVGKLSKPGDWDGSGAAGTLMGQPSDAVRNKYFQVFETTVRFGYNETN